MRRPRTLSMLAGSAALLLWGLPASAAEPGNDLVSGAVPVTVGFTQQLDTTLATTDGQDAALGRTCSGPAGPAGTTDASVWYSYTATTDGGVLVDVSASDYSAGVYVATGEPGSLSAEACGPQSVAFAAHAGTTYYVVAFDDQHDGSGNGGLLSISFSEAPPAPTVVVTIDPTGTFDPTTGAVKVEGALACTGADLVHVLGTVSEVAGRARTTGHFHRSSEGPCDGTQHPWTAVVWGEGTRFEGAKSTVVASSIACSRVRCAQGFSEQAVRFGAGPR